MKNMRQITSATPQNGVVRRGFWLFVLDEL